MTSPTSGKLQPSSYIDGLYNLEIPSSFGLVHVWLSLGAVDPQCIHRQEKNIFKPKKAGIKNSSNCFLLGTWNLPDQYHNSRWNETITGFVLSPYHENTFEPGKGGPCLAISWNGLAQSSEKWDCKSVGFLRHVGFNAGTHFFVWAGFLVLRRYWMESSHGHQDSYNSWASVNCTDIAPPEQDHLEEMGVQETSLQCECWSKIQLFVI